MTEQEEKKTQEACAAEKEETPAGECGCNAETCAEEPKEEKKALSVEELQTALQLAEAKVLEHYDLDVRAMAELENTRRRSAEEVQKARKFGIEKFAENLLPVVDSLEKALELTKEDEQNPLREGMAATYRQLTHRSPWCPRPTRSRPAASWKSSSAAGSSTNAFCAPPW